LGRITISLLSVTCAVCTHRCAKYLHLEVIRDLKPPSRKVLSSGEHNGISLLSMVYIPGWSERSAQKNSHYRQNLILITFFLGFPKSN